MNNKNTNKTLLMLSILSMMIVFGGIIPVYAVSVDYELTELWTQQFGSNDFDVLFSIDVAMDDSFVIGGMTHGIIGEQNFGISDGFLRFYNDTGYELWTKQYGTNSSESIYAVAISDNGNIVVGGYTFDSIPEHTNNVANAFIGMYDSLGNELWRKLFGTDGHDYVNSVSFTSDGNIVIGGTVGGDLPGQTSNGETDVFIGMYDSLGNELWTKQFGTDSYEYRGEIAVTSDDNIVVIGSTFGSFFGYSNAGNLDAFVSMYDNTGTEIWTKQFGYDGHDQTLAVAITFDDNIVIGGHTKDTLLGQTINGETDAFVRMYDSLGNELWTKQFGTYGDNESVKSLGILSDGTIVISGHTNGAFLSQTNSGNFDIFVGMYDSLGNELIIEQFGTTSLDDLRSLAVTSDDNVIVGGYTNGVFLNQTNFGDYDVFVKMYSIQILFCNQPESYYTSIITGTDFADYLIVTSGNDLIRGLGGNDFIRGSNGNDCIYAGDGNDFVLSANNGNTVYGGAGDDSIQLKGTGIAYGEDGDDSIYIINPSAGYLIDGGSDYDLCIASGNQPINTANCEIIVP